MSLLVTRFVKTVARSLANLVWHLSSVNSPFSTMMNPSGEDRFLLPHRVALRLLKPRRHQTEINAESP